MKILIPMAGFDKAGGFRVLSQLANHWIAAGHQVDFLVDERSPPPYFPTVARIRTYDSAGNIALHLRTASGFATKGNLISTWRGMLKGLNRIGAEYDRILANQSLTTFPTALARCGRASKWYYVQAYEPEYYALMSGPRAKVLRVLAWLSYKLPLHQVANSPIYLDYPQMHAQAWVPPGLDPAIYPRRAAPPTFAAGRPLVIGTIGRHEPLKGTADVLSAFELLAARNPDVRLSVAFGNLPEGWAHPRAEVVPLSGDAALAAWYRSIDILVAPGLAQLGACHYPVLEAMISGTPVITTGYLPADPSNAWIVPVRAPEAIARAVEDISATPPGALEAKLDAGCLAVERFHWDQVAREFLRLMGADAS